MYISKRKNSPFIENIKDSNFFELSGTLNVVITQSDGKILIGGNFTNYGGIAGRNYLVRLNSDGTIDTTFCINAVDGSKISNVVLTIVEQPDKKLLIGGNFTNYGSVANRNNFIRLNSDGTLDTAFCTNATDSKFGVSSNIFDISLQTDGKIIVAGLFINYAGTTGRDRLIRLNSDGTLDTAFCANATDGAKFNSSVSSIKIQSDSKILIGGAFSSYAGTTGRSYFIRLNSDGTLDTAFCANATDGAKFNNSVTERIILQSDGKILIGGNFTNYGGTTGRSYFIRINSNGTLDTAFCTNAVDGSKFSAVVQSKRVQSDGKILVGGTFSNYAGTTGRNRLIRLNSDGTLDTAFCINATDGTKFSSTVNSIDIQTNGDILLVGAFGNYAGTVNRNFFIRLNSDGTLNSTFCNITSDGSNFTVGVTDVLVQSDGKILAGGGFTSYDGITGRSYLIRLNSDASVDTSFCSNAVDGSKFISSTSAIAIQSDNKILVGGAFTTYAGTVGRDYLVRLNSDGTLDTTFCTNAVDGTKFNNTITTIAIQTDGKILVGGLFTNYAATTNRNRLVRLNSNGTIDTTFCTNAVDAAKFNNTVNNITIQSDGKILVGGGFSTYAGTANRNYFIRLNSDGTLDTTFCANATDGAKFGNVINTIATQSDGKILVGGNFTNYASTIGRNRIIRLNSDGTLDTTFCTNAVDGSKFSAAVSGITIQSDGKILIGGSFATYGLIVGRDYLVRLNSDGTVDSTFCTNASDGSKFNAIVYDIKLTQDKTILIAGNFSSYRISNYSKVKISYLTKVTENGVFK